MKFTGIRVAILKLLAFIVTASVVGAVQFNLNCVLGNGTVCTPFPSSFGTVTITDIAGGVSVVVDTAAGGKYKDLFLNLAGPPTTIQSPAVYSEGAFSLSPYDGKFDVGTSISPSKGFSGSDNSVFQILGTGFTAASFVALDTLNLAYVGIHLLEIDCTSTACVNGSGSIKVGGTLIQADDPGDANPEPATLAIVACGLAAIGWIRARQR